MGVVEWSGVSVEWVGGGLNWWAAKKNALVGPFEVQLQSLNPLFQSFAVLSFGMRH